MHTNFPYDLSLKMDSNPSLNGLDSFLKALGRLFFAEVGVKRLETRSGENQLVLNLRCHIGILDMLFHYNRGYWGHTGSGDAGQCTLRKTLTGMLRELQNKNSQPVDLEEINLELDDMLIVIRSIGPNSLARELDTILRSLGAHYVGYTHGLREVPYELYIPVSEAPDLTGPKSGSAGIQEFYKFWAVYYESESDARVYSLEERNLLSGELLLSNSD